MDLWQVQTMLPVVHRYYQAKSDVRDETLKFEAKLENDDIKRSLVPLNQNTANNLHKFKLCKCQCIYIYLSWINITFVLIISVTVTIN